MSFYRVQMEQAASVMWIQTMQPLLLPLGGASCAVRPPQLQQQQWPHLQPSWQLQHASVVLAAADQQCQVLPRRCQKHHSMHSLTLGKRQPCPQAQAAAAAAAQPGYLAHCWRNQVTLSRASQPGTAAAQPKSTVARRKQMLAMPFHFIMGGKGFMTLVQVE